MDDRAERAGKISDWLADHQNFKSHSRHISRNDIERYGSTTSPLEADEKIQDLTLSVFHAATHTFTNTSAVKIVESHTVRAFIKQHVVPPIQSIQLGVFPSAPAGAGQA